MGAGTAGIGAEELIEAMPSRAGHSDEILLRRAAVRTATVKYDMAIGTILGMRRKCFDVDAAYLQGRFVGQRVYARAVEYYRLYDERGVELV